MEEDQRYRMKFYFNGCSFTWGGELDTKCFVDPYEHRWTKLVSDHFGAEETNHSKRGGSNERVLRYLFAEDHNLESYDCIFIQLTFPTRQEFWNPRRKEWARLNPQFVARKPEDYAKHFGPDCVRWSEYYLTDLYTDKYGMTKELIAYNSIVSHLKLLGKPFFMSTVSKYRHINYDYNFSTEKYDRIPKDKHASVKGHIQIAEKIIHKVKDKL